MAFIWHSPRESRLHSASENACQPKIRRIVPELHVLYNVVCHFKVSEVNKGEGLTGCTMAVLHTLSGSYAKNNEFINGINDKNIYFISLYSMGK